MSRTADSGPTADRRTVRMTGRAIGGAIGMAIEARYEEILRAAGEVFARRGYHQASTREIAQAAGLSLAGLYHYVGTKDELLFLVLDRALDRLIAALDGARAAADSPDAELRALVQTHLDFAFREPHALRLINRDYELLAEPRRAEIAAKRQAYLHRGLAILRALDRNGRGASELLSATNLLLGMLNGIATRPFLRGADDARALGAQVASLFLHGFLARGGEAAASEKAAAPGLDAPGSAPARLTARASA
jgi:AcrR family transcriptional regulator